MVMVVVQMITFNSNNKRPRQDSPLSVYSTPEPDFPSLYSYHAAPTSTPSSGRKSSASLFLKVSACRRCMLRKKRCDPKLPACSSCEKAKLKCVGFDPVTKREIPRSYVYYLENRVAYLEDILVSHDTKVSPPEDFDVVAPKTSEVPSLDPSQQRPMPIHSPASPAESVEANRPSTGDSSEELGQSLVARESRAATHQTTVSHSSATAGTPNSNSTYNIDNNIRITQMGPASAPHGPHSHLHHPQPISFCNGISTTSLAEPGCHSQPHNITTELAEFNSELEPEPLLSGRQSALSMGGAYIGAIGLNQCFNANEDGWDGDTGPYLFDGDWFSPGWSGSGSMPWPERNERS